MSGHRGHQKRNVNFDNDYTNAKRYQNSDQFDDTYQTSQPTAFRGRGGRGSGTGRGFRGGGRGNMSTTFDTSRLGPGPQDISRPRSRSVDFNNTGASGSVKLKIEGFQGIDPEAIFNYLNKKSSKPFTVIEHGIEGSYLIVQVKTFLEAEALKRLSGIRMGQNNKLIITNLTDGRSTPVSSPSHSSAQKSAGSGAIDTLTQLIQSRYDPNSKFLNLENLRAEPGLIHVGLEIFGLSHNDQRSSKAGAVLCKLMAQICPDVESISFANNSMHTLAPISSLPMHIPNLINLSFENNKLTSYRDIDPLPGKYFTRLRELLFIGNPVLENAKNRSGAELRYRSDVKKIFPTIQVLDRQPVVGEIKFDLGDVVDGNGLGGLDIKGGFCDSDSTGQTSSEFLGKFFTLFDGNRAGLLDLYDPAASFSLSICKTSSSSSVGRQYKLNRNLNTVHSTSDRLSTLIVGNTSIVETFTTNIPTTSHPIHEPLEKQKLIVDSYQRQSGGVIMLVIHVHGEFTEVQSRSTRSFSRTFVIIPSAPGSRSAQSGYPFTIINDQWTIRSFNSRPGWIASNNHPATTDPSNASVVPPQLGDMNTIAQMQAYHRTNEAQHNSILQFSQATGLNYQYCFQCLNETAWDMNAAMRAFQNAKPNLPQQAFVYTPPA